MKAISVARHEGHQHVGNALADPAHLAVVHRDEAGGDVRRVAGAGAEVPRPGQPVAAVDDDALAVGEELAAHRDVVVVGGEHLREALVGQIGRRGERRRQVRDADPAE